MGANTCKQVHYMTPGCVSLSSPHTWRRPRYTPLILTNMADAPSRNLVPTMFPRPGFFGVLTLRAEAWFAGLWPDPRRCKQLGA